MKYKKSERVQSETYYSAEDFVNDVIETLQDEDNFEKSVNIVSDRFITEGFLELINQRKSHDFIFDIQLIDFREDIDEYMTTILDDGEVYVEPATDKNGKYHEMDGFLFVHKDISAYVYNGRNRRCDTMIFDINT